MALFGKKEKEEIVFSTELPPVKKDLPKDQEKIMPKNTESVRGKDTKKETTYLGKNLTINGNVTGEGSLIILGKFEGEFDLDGQLKIAQGAEVKGSIKATGVSINGNVDGTIVASERILLDTTASIKGRLVTPKISIQDGAVFDGELQMSRKSEQVPKIVPAEVKQPPQATPIAEAK